MSIVDYATIFALEALVALVAFTIGYAMGAEQACVPQATTGNQVSTPAGRVTNP